MTKPPSTQNRGISARLMDQPYLLLALAPLFWGGNVVAAKLVIGEMDPLVLLAARCVGATLFISPFAWPYLAKDWPVIRRTWPLLMAYGLVGYALYNALLYIGVHYTTGINSSIEQASLPMLIMAANFIIFRVRATPLQIAGVLIALYGVILTATHGDPTKLFALELNIGDGLVLLACLTYTAYTLALKYRPKIALMSFMMVAFSGAAISALVMLQLFGGGIGKMAGLANASPLGWGVIIFVMIFPSMFSQLFYARGVELLGANRAAPSHNLIPVYGLLLSVLILGERLELYHYMAIAIIVGGIFLAEWAARRKRGKASSAAQ